MLVSQVLISQVTLHHWMDPEICRTDAAYVFDIGGWSRF